MDINEIRFKQGDTLVFTMSSGKIVIGGFVRGPQIDYDYWTLNIPDDGTIIALKGSNVETIMKMSQETFNEFLQEQIKIQEDYNNMMQGVNNASKSE